MTDWAQLSHAYGSAEKIPTLLDRIASEPDGELWSGLWSALCHQGSVYSASFAALPWLAGVAAGDDAEQAVNALTLAGAITGGAHQPHGAGDVRTEYAGEISKLLSLANEHLRNASERKKYIELLEAVLSLEGVLDWSEPLTWGLAMEEYEIPCPGCEAMLFIVVGERGFFSTSGDYAVSDDDLATAPLRPADPAGLEGIARRLHAVAVADGQREIAEALTFVFGDATCPDCERDFSVADQVSAEWSAMR
ncbi:hypothetical protein AB0D29_31815 [Streptomyces sp. NPDC048424]|uniref:hypothetical protein n=1 Tax=Streptomyces sp. NPDC048424 TaxID=3155265 RepID=UPI0034233486